MDMMYNVYDQSWKPVMEKDYQYHYFDSCNYWTLRIVDNARESDPCKWDNAKMEPEAIPQYSSCGTCAYTLAKPWPCLHARSLPSI